jgi:hypothetical protein
MPHGQDHTDSSSAGKPDALMDGDIRIEHCCARGKTRERRADGELELEDSNGDVTL